ncbi:SDR family oxidoreductase [Kaistella palustris]|uniref:SDR family oxidoreductase n=1 Tax=Kaistella palustris TaxID=493376 RepID=UPI0003FBFA58|nr:SDR family oxidoreductase [Kaistella palustris]
MKNTLKNFAENAERTAKKQQEIQKHIDELDAKSPKKEKSKEDDEKQKAVQAGSQVEPAPPFPGQKLKKPGLEKDMELEPRYEAPNYKGSEKLKGKVALITGADSGIGRAVAVLFAREGADVAIVYLNEHEDAAATRKAVEKEGRRALTIAGDVADPGFCKAAVEETVKELGTINILVNNAAFQAHAEGLDWISPEHFDMTMKTNLYGYFYMAKAVLPHLNEGDSIINTSSVNGLFGNEKMIDYSLTKGGINAFTQSLAKNLVEKGIRVNAVAPGPVWTPLNPADQKKEDVKKFGAENPMKRAAQPEELSPTYVFLAAPACSSYITGQIIGVLGGVSN